MCKRWMIIAAVVMMMIAVTGCSTKQSIRYNLRDIIAEPRAGLEELTIAVDLLRDNRASIEANKPVFYYPRKTNINGKSMYINAEEGYESATVSQQVTADIIKHLEKKGCFKIVAPAPYPGADFTLKASLNRLYGEQEYSAGAEIGSYFGLIGALATAGAKTNGTISVVFGNITINSSDNTVTNLADITEEYQGELPVDAYGWSIYGNVNQRLKIAVEKLVANICSAVDSLVQQKTY